MILFIISLLLAFITGIIVGEMRRDKVNQIVKGRFSDLKEIWDNLYEDGVDNDG